MLTARGKWQWWRWWWWRQSGVCSIEEMERNSFLSGQLTPYYSLLRWLCEWCWLVVKIGWKKILVELWMKTHCCHCASIASMELSKGNGVVAACWRRAGRRASGVGCGIACMQSWVKKKDGWFVTLDVKYFEFEKYLIRLNSIKNGYIGYSITIVELNYWKSRRCWFVHSIYVWMYGMVIVSSVVCSCTFIFRNSYVFVVPLVLFWRYLVLGESRMTFRI